jgi:DegV family protein with EDD domain
MARTKIVTDSSADLTPELAAEWDITVVPARLQVGTEMLEDVPALRSPEFYRRVIKNRTTINVLPPTAAQFAEVYGRLAQETNDIVSIHISAQLNRTVRAANEGRVGFLGRCNIAVMDSRFISCALGFLVIEAAKAAQAGATGHEIVRLVRGLISRLYLAFNVETLEHLRRNNLVEQPRSPLGMNPNYRPLLMLEDGIFTPLQRMHGRGTAIERLVEFVAEFAHLERLTIIHSGLGSEIAELKTQLNGLVPAHLIDEHIYGPVFEAYTGPTALGVVAYEG